MSNRNLLPLLRKDPNPANIAPAQVGEWTAGQIGAELPKLDFGRDRGNALRNRVQSIPSPWARMTLFQNALDTDGHPARQLVESELLDAFEFMWELNAISGAPPEFRTIRLPDLKSAAESVGSERVEDFASALVALVPGAADRTANDTKAFSSISVLMLDGRPILASSPFTGIFTAEDAAGSRTGQYFKYLHDAPLRTLRDRPFEFQKYVAEVLLPQLDEVAQSGVDSSAWSSVRSLLKPWLQKEVEECNRRRPQTQALLTPARGWRERAAELKLSPIWQPLGGISFYKRNAGAAAESSTWRLATGRGGAAAPLVLDPALFDGVLFHGATSVTLPSDLSSLDRDVLPVLGTRYPWVSPATDWFTERLLFLNEPISHKDTFGYAKLENSYRGDNQALKNAQFVLPLQPEILKYFEPEALEKMVQIQVYDSGQVEIKLSLQLGADGAVRPVEIRKRYETAQHFRATGPSVSLYPTFRDARWRNYTVFSLASNEVTGVGIRVSAYNANGQVKAQRVKRSTTVEVLALGEAPDAIGFDTHAAGTGERESGLGLLLPRYQKVRAASQESWNVGVDFGTSNTVVCVRPDGPVPAAPLSFDDGLLDLTEISDETRRATSAYFFPERFRSGPFGTAVVHHNYLEQYDLAQEAPGLRINVPFTGLVESDEQNTVVGDLKWSTDQRTDFLAGSFLRTVLSIILSEGLKKGIEPSRIKIRWAYPRAFSKGQINNLTRFWEAVIKSFQENGLNILQPAAPQDESAAVLAHFFNDQKLAPGGETSLLIDVGGGTSDLVICEYGKALALDSILFGGKILTGQRVQGNTQGTRENPFVRAFASWARANGLDANSAEGKALNKYLRDGQDHLAFSYAVSTKWFANQGRRFVTDPAFVRLQGQILYFYAALFYYSGLTLRDLRQKQKTGSTGLPSTVIVAGNGSQYLHWLTEIVPAADSVFRTFLARIMAVSAGTPDHPLPQIRISDSPKLEVALGLVAQASADLHLAGAVGESLVGENLSVHFSQGGAQTLTSVDRLRPDWSFAAADVPSLRFSETNSEISAFHKAFLADLPSLVSYGAQWGEIASTYRDLLGKLKLRELHAYVSSRLQYLAQLGGGYRGSILMLEATAVLEMTATELFAGSPALGSNSDARGTR
ncbi:MAG: cell division protein FtsA [bacterium]